MNETEIIFLEISSWQGYSAGAEHYYGKILCHYPEYKTVEVSKKMTAKEARELSKKDDWKYHEGSTTTRFETREEIEKIAVAQYKSDFPNGKILVLGNSASYEPKKILDGPSDLKQKANAIYEQYEAIPIIWKYGFGNMSPNDREKADKLTDDWEKLVNAEY